MINPEENPVVQIAVNPSTNPIEEIKKIDKELEECRQKMFVEALTYDAKQVVRRRVDDLLDKRLAWMEQSPNAVIKIEDVPAKKARKNKMLKLMRRKSKL